MGDTTLSTPPRKRRSVAARNHSPSLNVTTDNNTLLDANDDAKERRARRKSQLLSNNISSPGGVPASPGRVNVAADRERRKSVAPAAGMSNEQVKLHYASCIKLSSENKINVKNAFALHLIDYMKDLLQESQNADSGTNFQVASCTLDAGVKIYSYRVDSVHKDTFKVLGSLGGTVDNKDDEDGEEGGEGAEEGGDGTQRPKVVKKRKKVTIEKNLTKITSEEFDLDFEEDPYFHKTSSAFDEGGVKGLLMLQVRASSDNIQLRMDSNSVILDEEVKIPMEDLHADINPFKSAWTRSNSDTLDVCPATKSFKVSGWDKDEASSQLQLDSSYDDNVHRFDQNAPVIPAEATMDAGMDYAGGDGADDFSDNETEGLGQVEFDGREAQFASAANASLMNLTGSSQLPLEIFQTSEYSFFKTDILSMWRGPLHWKHIQKAPLGMSISGAAKKPRPKKDPFRIDFDDDDIDLKKKLSSGRAQTYLTEHTLKKHTLQMTTLPPKVIYDVKNLFNMFLQDKFLLKHMKEIPTSTLEKEGNDDYNYDNKNDVEGFCPAVDDGYDDDYDDDDVGGAPDASFNATSQAMGVEACGSETLIAPPTKVRMLDINYAKSAKNIDIKKLKKAMWNMLTIKDTEEKENADTNNLPRPDVISQGEEEDETNKSVVSGNYTFRSMYQDLPSKITTNMAKNLSGPIAFVCMLYLANEKNLSLKTTDTMDDVVIKSNIVSNVA